jgi:Putative endonuclease segE, GIY-YIG domain
VYLSPWRINGVIYEPYPEELALWMGFVYMITENSTGKKYIGKKLFWSKRTKPAKKGKTRKTHMLVESDWKSYYSSNKQINEKVAIDGGKDYTREILKLCVSKGEMSYWEAKLQFDNDVLLRDDFYNGIINCRVNAGHIKHLHHINKT